MDRILDKAMSGEKLTRADALTLLHIDDDDKAELQRLFETANAMTRKIGGDKGYIFAQVGINSRPCTGCCKFCSLANCNYAIDGAAEQEKSLDELDITLKELDKKSVSDIFIMTTADYDRMKFLDVMSHTKKTLKNVTRLVANTGDFDYDYAVALKKAGVTGAYHILRLREGVDTDISPKQRLKTIDAILSAGLELYYCIEPIGSEHTYDELVNEMERARDYGVDIMAAMRRVGVEGTKFYNTPSISDDELLKIVAVTRLFVNPKKSMNVHEPIERALYTGVNQLYAECGINPRDTSLETEKKRGFTIDNIEKMMRKANFK